MKVAYRFNSKHLGKAFMEELLEMGYKRRNEWLDDYHNVDALTVIDGRVNLSMEYSVNYNECKNKFILESQYAEALAFAREQIEQNTKFFDWDVEYQGTLIRIAPDYKNGFTFTKQTLSFMKDALENVSDKSVQEVINELEKLDL